MQKIDQDSANRSLQQALVPAPGLIDGRTEKDWLRFLSGFAGLINFYDQDNKVNGSWAPFLLKDPLFLTAAIAGTPFGRYHKLYIDTVAELKKDMATQGHTQQVAFRFNHLFNQLTHLFVQIKHWIHQMHTANDDYALKNYVIREAGTTISPYFWALNSLRQNLHLTQYIKGIEPVETSRFPLYSAYEEKVWKQNKDRSPYWDVLELKHPITDNTPREILGAVTAAADIVFRFFHTVIHHAGTEFDKIKEETGSYPDTVLLRSFVSLLKIYQDQLNAISQRHLSFYYRDILKQHPQGAVADSAFLYITLAKKEPFMLPAGTQFNAGADADKQPVIFATTADTPLNPAAITGACTLSVAPAGNSLYSLYLNTVDKPTAIQTDENGIVQPWQTFGGAAALPAAKVNTGIAFASPMLLLREGNRKISFTFTFAEECDPQLLKGAAYYLSTQQAWLDVTSGVSIPDDGNTGSQLIVDIMLSDTQPAIEAFTKNPDGIESSWPMLKLVFENITAPGSPPVVTTLGISVSVTGMKNLTLYNDYGPLSTKNPYPPFGPAPLYNSSFIIGSDEIFSKPVNTLYFELDWNNLPEFGFDAYYNAYNEYITSHTEELGIPADTKKLNIFQWIRKRFYNFENSLISVFNNCSFTVSFQQLQNNVWQDITVNGLQDITLTDNCTVTPVPYPQDNNCNAPQGAEGILLFNSLYNDDNDVHANKCNLQPSSFFSYAPLGITGADSDLQDTPLKFSDTSTGGFIRMLVKGPDRFGFGSGLYPKVVGDVAMQNAYLIKDASSDTKYKASANLPYVPTLTTFTAHYTASISYDLTTQAGGPPVQCFWYTPFSNYKIYDSVTPAPSFTVLGDTGTGSKGIPLFSPAYYDGYLFLKMENAAVSNQLSLYAEMAGGFGNVETKQAGYYYMSANGWKNLPLLADGTNNFSCPGIITVNLPQDMAGNKTLTGDENYYIAIGVKGNPSSYGKIIAVNTNGLCAVRVLSDEAAINGTPQIAAGTITKTQTAVPQVATVNQPFPSFGGKAPEDESLMNIRVSNRLKTKGRVVSSEDYYRAIHNEFTDIYYSRPVYNPAARSTCVYIVKGYADSTDANAAQPLATTCEQSKIADFLQQRVSAFTKVSVSNFRFQYLQVVADVVLLPNYECVGVQKAVNSAIAAFLAPWVLGSASAYNIGEPVTNLQITHCIQHIEGILEVNKVTLYTWTDAAIQPVGPLQSVMPATDDLLIVSCGQHKINCS